MKGGETVIAVVGLNRRPGFGSEVLRLAELEGPLHGAQMERGLTQWHGTDVPVEHLEVLDRIPFYTCPQRSTNDAVEVDKQPRAQHAVDFGFAGAVTPHQAPQRCRLIGGVVVDVEIGVALPALGHRIDEHLESRSLRLGGQGPPRPIYRCPLLQDRVAKEVLHPAVPGEGIALEVQEDIAQRGLGQACQTLAGFAVQEFVHRLIPLATLELDPGLLMHPLKRLPGAPTRTLERHWQARKTGQRGHSLSL